MGKNNVSVKEARYDRNTFQVFEGPQHLSPWKMTGDKRNTSIIVLRPRSLSFNVRLQGVYNDYN